MPLRREGLTHPPRSLLLAASLCGCLFSYRDAGESLLAATLVVALVGGALLAALDRVWAPLLPPRPPLRGALLAAVAVGVVATVVALAMTTEASSRHWAGAEGDPATLHARAFIGRVRIGAQFFGTAVLAWTLLAWRILLRVRPRRAARALPVALGLSALLAWAGAVVGGGRALPEALFVFLYWSGTLGVVPLALWCALMLEGVVRRRALARKES